MIENYKEIQAELEDKTDKLIFNLMGWDEKNRDQTLYEKVMEDMGPVYESHHFDKFSLRGYLVKRFSWAIPSWEAIKAIRSFGKDGVVEVGAGKGYWSYLMNMESRICTPYDKEPSKKWSVVKIAPNYMLKNNIEKALMLCWPCYAEEWSSNVLKSYLEKGGKKLIFVGEERGGCTGTDSLHDLMDGMKTVEEVYIPQWYGIHDTMRLLEVQ